MSIVITIPCLLKGGTEFQTLHLVRTLVSLRQELTVLVYFEKDSEMVEAFERAGAIVHCFNWSRNLKGLSFIRQLAKHLRVLKPDIVHVQYMAPGALPILAAKYARVKRIIATVHQPYTIQHGWKAKLILRSVSRLCKPFLAVSQNAERSWFGSTHLLDPNITIATQARHLTLYNCIDIDRINSIPQLPKADLPEGLNTNEIIIGTVGRMRYEKGMDLLIIAFEKISKVHVHAQLLLVGDGPDMENYQTLALNLNISNKVFFYGDANWEKAMQLMSIMNIVVVPSRFEGFGLTAAEAMAMGKPVIASDTFGLKELIDHEQTGLLFENENDSELAEQVLRFLKDARLSEKCVLNASQKALTKFDYPIFVQNISCLYHLDS